MTTFLLLSSVAINIVLIVAHKRLNNSHEKLEDELEMANENTAYWRDKIFEAEDSSGCEFPMSKRI